MTMKKVRVMENAAKMYRRGDDIAHCNHPRQREDWLNEVQLRSREASVYLSATCHDIIKMFTATWTWTKSTFYIRTPLVLRATVEVTQNSSAVFKSGFLKDAI